MLESVRRASLSWGEVRRLLGFAWIELVRLRSCTSATNTGLHTQISAKKCKLSSRRKLRDHSDQNRGRRTGHCHLTIDILPMGRPRPIYCRGPFGFRKSQAKCQTTTRRQYSSETKQSLADIPLLPPISLKIRAFYFKRISEMYFLQHSEIQYVSQHIHNANFLVLVVVRNLTFAQHLPPRSTRREITVIILLMGQYYRQSWRCTEATSLIYTAEIQLELAS